jgi:2-oxoglutarate ferredoxin oxidoreductase subunit delta
VRRINNKERFMANPEKKDRGILQVDVNECKGCGMCVEACVPHVITMSERMNHYGYHTATYVGAGCTGCGICSMVCPEPGALTVYRLDPVVAAAASVQHAGLGGVA